MMELLTGKYGFEVNCYNHVIHIKKIKERILIQIIAACKKYMWNIVFHHFMMEYCNFKQKECMRSMG